MALSSLVQPNLTPELLERENRLQHYHQDGFALVRNVFSNDETAQMKRAFERLAKLARSLKSNATVKTSRFVISPPTSANPSAIIHRVIWAGGVEPILQKFGQDPRLLQLAASVLERETLVQLINQAHFKYPRDGVEFPWHQDSRHRRQGTNEFKDLNGRGSFVETITAVDAMTLDNGPLEVLVGSHVLGHLGDSFNDVLPQALLQFECRKVIMNPGDVLLLSPFTFHRSQPNLDVESRFAFLNGFALPGASRRNYPGCGFGRFRRASL